MLSGKIKRVLVTAAMLLVTVVIASVAGFGQTAAPVQIASNTYFYVSLLRSVPGLARLADPLSKRTAAICGLRPITDVAPRFISRCRRIPRKGMRPLGRRDSDVRCESDARVNLPSKHSKKSFLTRLKSSCFARREPTYGAGFRLPV